jgi:hypothetical protein
VTVRVGEGRHGARALTTLLLAALGPSGVARSDELSGYVELMASEATSERSDGLGQVEETETELLQQRYSLNLSRRLFPNLDLAVGGLFQRADTRIDSPAGRLESTDRVIYPYAILALRTRLYGAEVAFERQQERVTAPGAPAARSQRDLYRASFGWTPPGLAHTRLDALRTQDYAGPSLRPARTDNVLQLTSDYRRGSVYAYYRGFVERTDEFMLDSRVDSTAHTGRLRYGDSWWKGRVSLSSDLALDYRKTETVRPGEGVVEFPLSPIEGLALLDDTPERDALAPNAALVDGDRTASAGVNLGLPSPGGDDRLRNLGLDLGSESRLNTLRVWVDRALPPEIASAFSWRVFVSQDGEDWTLAFSAGAAPFGPFDNRFDIETPELVTRHIKVVVAPLAPTAPFAADHPSILVTELEAVLRRRAGELATEASTTARRATVGLRARLLPSQPLHYEMAYFLTDASGAPERFSLSNGLSYSHKLGPVYSVAARVARIDGEERERGIVTHTYSASLGAQPLATLRHNLVLSGSRAERLEGTREFTSLILSSFLEVRRGVEVGASLGRSVTLDERDRRLTTDLVNAGATLVPHPTTTVTVSLQDRSVESGAAALDSRDQRGAELGLAWRPVPAFYLVASHRLEETGTRPRRRANDFILSWAPFSEGALQLSVSYGETLRSRPDSTQERLTPGLRWNITPSMFAELTYSRFRSEFRPVTSDTEAVTATLRASF